MFKNVNLLRNINLEKAYVKEFVSVVIENTDANPQHEYYIPFAASIVAQVGGLEVRDNKNPEDPPYKVELVAYDETRYSIQNPGGVICKADMIIVLPNSTV